MQVSLYQWAIGFVLVCEVFWAVVALTWQRKLYALRLKVLELALDVRRPRPLTLPSIAQRQSEIADRIEGLL